MAGLVKDLGLVDMNPRKETIIAGTPARKFEITELPLKDFKAIQAIMRDFNKEVERYIAALRDETQYVPDFVTLGSTLPRILSAFGVPQDACDTIQFSQLQALAVKVIAVLFTPKMEEEEPETADGASDGQE